jgi:ABC-type polysaccharide/polyol phosphate transport system ATPase subunit
MNDSIPDDKLAISARNLGKMYRLYERPQDRLKEQLLWRFGKHYGREFWALRDVSFDVCRGETVGIIGRNGSGKSTLLQIIAGTLASTSGEVRSTGRVCALLELGSGFNLEFTGRENAFLSGAIAGIGQEEMQQRYQEIVDFADIGDFINQPVKVYSTGMFLRLAFSIQVLLNPDVLIVDEALAVGDAAFQMKCYNRMRQLSEQGTAIILVTHETQTVRSFCHRAIWLDEGVLKAAGAPLEVTSKYVQFLFHEQTAKHLPAIRPLPATTSNEKQLFADQRAESNSTRVLLDLSARTDLVRWGSGELQISAVGMDNGRPMREMVFEYGDRIHIEFEIRVQQSVFSDNIGFGFAFRNLKGLDIITSTTFDDGRRINHLEAGQIIRISFEVDNILAPGNYALILSADDRSERPFHYYDFIENVCLFKVASQKNIFSLVLPPVEQAIAPTGVERQGDE